MGRAGGGGWGPRGGGRPPRQAGVSSPRGTPPGRPPPLPGGAGAGRGGPAGGDVDAVAAVGAAGHDAVQEDHPVAVLQDVHVVVAHPGQRLRQLGQLVVVGGEQRRAADRGRAGAR